MVISTSFVHAREPLPDGSQEKPHTACGNPSPVFSGLGWATLTRGLWHAIPYYSANSFKLDTAEMAIVPFADVTVGVAVIAVVGLATYGMFGDIQGGGKPFDDWFGYHVSFMVLGVQGLMTLGRWSYALEGESLTKETRRNMHRAFMVTGVLAMGVGYLSIYKAHAPKNQFFGYDFVNGEWKEWKRLVHVYLGYSCIVLSVVQAVMGMMKLRAAQDSGEKIFGFHGFLGKAILLLAMMTVLMATWLWTWSVAYKRCMVIVSCILGAAAVVPHGPVGGVELSPLLGMGNVETSA